MQPRRYVSATFLASAALAALALSACSKEELKPDLTPRLGVLELPMSHRTADPAPGDAAHMEITPTELLLEGASVLALEKGKIPTAERAGYDLPKLKQKLGTKRTLALGVYAAIPYGTLARVLHTAFGSGVHEVAFRVRKPNSTSEPGWLTIGRSHFVESAEDGKFGADLLPWDSFGKVWEESLAACQESTRADCGYKPLAKAQGGKLDMMLRVSGGGLALRFRQADAAPASPSARADAGRESGQAASQTASKPKSKPRRRRAKEELLDGIKGGPEVMAEEEALEPVTEHVFTLRSDQATVPDSPVSGIVKPLCGSVACPIVLDAEGISMVGQVLSLLGAAFPDGTPAPRVAWVLPPKDD